MDTFLMNKSDFQSKVKDEFGIQLTEIETARIAAIYMNPGDIS